MGIVLQHRFLITEASMIQCLENWLKLKVNYTADNLFWCIIENNSNNSSRKSYLEEILSTSPPKILSQTDASSVYAVMKTS